jgi:hypothetical protein
MIYYFVLTEYIETQSNIDSCNAIGRRKGEGLSDKEI